MKLPSDVFVLTRLNYRKRTDGLIPAALNGAVLSNQNGLYTLGSRTRAVAPQVDPDALTEAEFDGPKVLSAKSDAVRDGDRLLSEFRGREVAEGIQASTTLQNPVSGDATQRSLDPRSRLHAQLGSQQYGIYATSVVAGHITMEELDQVLDLPTMDDD